MICCFPLAKRGGGKGAKAGKRWGKRGADSGGGRRERGGPGGGQTFQVDAKLKMHGLPQKTAVLCEAVSHAKIRLF